MSVDRTDFEKIWASTSPLTPYSFTESNYKEGWNFVGATPPARQMWDSIQKKNDEKMKYILTDVCVPVATQETNSTSTSYSVSAPSDKVFANFNKFYGKTLAWNQLVDTGTSSVTLISGHKYYTLINGTASIQTGAGSAISVTGGTDKVTDLTLAFGSGNEPTTAEFEALFPNYATMAYNAGTLISASVSNVKSKDSSNNVIANMPIPSAIQSLPCYGASAGSVKNYIDFENKKYMQNVGAVDIGTLNWAYYGTFFWVSFSEAKPPLNNDVPINAVNEKYIVVSHNNTWNDNVIWYVNGELRIKDTSAGTDATAFKTAMSGVMLYYELATPIEHDISDILGATGIACSASGTLTFENSNGSDYQLPVQYDLDFVEGTDGLLTVQDKEKLEVAYESANVDPFKSVGKVLGKVYTASGSNSTANSVEIICSIKEHPAGVFFAYAFIDLSFSANIIYSATLRHAIGYGRTVRQNGTNGGGICVGNIFTLTENQQVDLLGMFPSGSGSIRGQLSMIQLA